MALLFITEKKLREIVSSEILSVALTIMPDNLDELQVGCALISGKFSELERGRVYTWAEKNKKKVSIKRLPNGNMVVTRVA